MSVISIDSASTDNESNIKLITEQWLQKIGCKA